MANTIKIKRRAAAGGAGAPGSLANGELAFNEATSVLYYGDPVGPVAIAGDGAFLSTANAPAQLLNQPSSGGFWVDKGTPVRINRVTDRVFLGAARDASGSYDKTAATTFLSAHQYWVERSATVLSIGLQGGIGLAAAVRASDRYTTLGYAVWQPGLTVAIGAKYGTIGRLYHATTAGVTGSTAPTHTTGTASDGGVTWAFDDYVYHTPAAAVFQAVSDAGDGQGTWASLHSIEVRSTGSTGYAQEIDVINLGSAITSDPYNVSPGKSSHGIWLTAGGVTTAGESATNDSTVGITIGSWTKSFLTGINFAANGISGTDGSTGYGSAIKFAKGHFMQAFGPGGTGETAKILFNGSSNASRMGLWFDDDIVKILSQGVSAATIENGAGAGNAIANYMRLIGVATGQVAAIKMAGDTNASMSIQPAGAGFLALYDGAGASKVKVSTAGIGFFGASPAAKPNLTGSGVGAGVYAIAAALATLGLATNSMTA